RDLRVAGHPGRLLVAAEDVEELLAIAVDGRVAVLRGEVHALSVSGGSHHTEGDRTERDGCGTGAHSAGAEQGGGLGHLRGLLSDEGLGGALRVAGALCGKQWAAPPAIWTNRVSRNGMLSGPEKSGSQVVSSVILPE